MSAPLLHHSDDKLGSRTFDKKLGEKTTETTETTETTVKDDTRLRCCLSRLSRLSRLSHSLTELKLCASTRRFSPQAERLPSNN